MATLTFAVRPTVVDIPGKTALVQARIDIDPEISVAATVSYSAPILSVAYAAAIDEYTAYLTGVIFRSVFEDVIQGVVEFFGNKVGVARSVTSSTIAPSEEYDVAAGYNVGSIVFNPTERVYYTCLDATLDAAVWVASGAPARTTLYRTQWGTDWAADIATAYDYSRQPAQFTAFQGATQSGALESNLGMNPKRTSMIAAVGVTGSTGTFDYFSIANRSLEPPSTVTERNVVGNTAYRVEPVTQSAFLFQTPARLSLFTYSGGTVTNEAVGANRTILSNPLAVSYHRRWFVCGPTASANAIQPATLENLTVGTPTFSLQAAYTPRAGVPPTCVEFSKAPPNILFLGFATAPFLYRVQMGETGTASFLASTLVGVTAYSGGAVRSLKATPGNLLAAVDDSSLYVLRVSDAGGAVSVSQLASAVHGLSGTFLAKDAIAVSNDETQIVVGSNPAAPNGTNNFGVYEFDEQTLTLSRVTQTSLPTALNGIQVRSVQYGPECSTLFLVGQTGGTATVGVLY